MSTGNYKFNKSVAWKIVTAASAAGDIILQNQGTMAIHYFIGSSPPTTQLGVVLDVDNEHTPKVDTGEELYVRCIHQNGSIAWSN